jgi:hypothetical protein
VRVTVAVDRLGDVEQTNAGKAAALQFLIDQRMLAVERLKVERMNSR